MKHPINNHPVIQSYIRYNNFGREVGMEFELTEPGQIIYKVEITEKVLATPRAAHGGFVATLMDATLGVAALSLVCEEDQLVSTVELSVNYLAPALLGDHLTADAVCISRGKRLLYFEGKIRNQTGKVIAAGKGTFNAYPAIKANL